MPFIKRDTKAGPEVKDFAKSQATKRSWGRGKRTYAAGIRDYHKSPEGKLMHRKLGRFLATRNTVPKSEYKSALADVRKDMHPDLLKEATQYKYMVRRLPAL